MRPGLFAVGRKVLRVGLHQTFYLSRLFDRKREVLTLCISNRLFATIKVEPDLAGCVVDAGPPHDRVTGPFAAGEEFKHPIFGFCRGRTAWRSSLAYRYGHPYETISLRRNWSER